MHLKNTIRGVLSGRWAKVVPGVVTAVLLLPVPVLAFQFTGSWQVAQLLKGTAAPTPTFSSTDNGTIGGSLIVNMGSYSNATPDFSSISLTRQVTISDPIRDTVQETSTLQGTFYNMRYISIDTSFVPNNPDASGPSKVTRNMTPTHQTNVNTGGPGGDSVTKSKKFGFYQNSGSNLTYTVRVTVSFAKYNPGSWNASQITFNFTQL